MAKQLLYTGDVIDADEALRIGLVNYVVDDLMDYVKKLARKIASRAGVSSLLQGGGKRWHAD